MRPTGPIETDIALLGAGHAHVEVLRRFALNPWPGVRLTLIAREPETPYSGMLPGLIRGDYTHDQAHIDLAPLAASAKARLIIGEAAAFDPETRTVRIPGRPDVPFDILSIDIGGLPAMPEGRGISVKPIGRFLGSLERMETELPSGARVAVIGGGAGGTELILALSHRFAGSLRLTLVSATPDPVPSAPPAVRRSVRQALVDAGIELACGVRASALRNGRLGLSDGSFIEADTALWATGVVGPPILAASGVACDESGCIRVSRTFVSISHDFIFAAGDCAAVDGAPRPKAGVWAVRAGAPLADNLRRSAQRMKLIPWRPQRDALAILGLGDGKAVAWRNGIAVEGRFVWWLKDCIDRRWMRMYTEMQMPVDPHDPMRCGGCGAKVSADVLSAALAAIPRERGPELLDGPDDASVVKPPPGRLLVQSVDHFRAFLDDPYIFGQITAAHALSDIHAMGADPWTALAIASVPYASSHKMRADLTAMLLGASEVLRGDGCSLVGGHSAEATEAALGFAITGLVNPNAVLRKSGLRPGDHLILTKPLGTGIILAGHMRGLAKAQWLAAAITSMRMTNAEAAKIVRGFAPRAATDVTGFGLAGHLKEMLDASGVAAVLWQDAIPALPGAMSLAARGVESTLAEANRRWLGRLPNAELLADPQTSGGLLVGLSADRAEACVRAMREAGIEAAAIGEVVATQDGEPPMRLS
jgi:selenide,water dikinase